MSKASTKSTTTSNSSNYSVVKIEDLDLKKLAFKDLKKNKYGGNFCNITYDGKIPKIIFPRMMCPFGISSYEDEKNGKISYGLETSLEDKKENNNLKAVYDKCVEFDKFIIKSVQEKYKMFNYQLDEGEKPDIKVLKTFYKPLVKPSLDKDRKPTNYSSRIKSSLIPTGEGKFLINCFDENLKPVEINIENFNDVVGPKDEVSTAKVLRQIWFSSMGFGTSWDIKQMRVFKSEENSDNPEDLMTEQEKEDRRKEKEQSLTDEEDDEEEDNELSTGDEISDAD